MNNAILVNANPAYFKYFEVFLRSLKNNYPDHPDLIVYYRELTSAHLEFLNSYSKVVPMDMDQDELPSGPVMADRNPVDAKIFYSRYNLFSERFSNYEKILYLDIDIIVLRPLDDLFDNFNFAIFADSYNEGDPILSPSSSPEVDSLLKEDGCFPLSGPGGNAGVFLVPPTLRARSNFEKIVRLTQRYYPYLIWGDQSVLNLWLLQEGLTITNDYRFNFQTRLFDQRRGYREYKSAYLLHFNGLAVNEHLPLLMNLAYVFWRIPLAGKWFYYCAHRFILTQRTSRFRFLNEFYRTLYKLFPRFKGG